MMHKVHMRPLENREAIILNEFGQPIGPVTPEKDTPSEFSRFLGTIARDYGYAPLIYNSWHYVPNKENTWEYVLNYTPPENGSGIKDAYLAVMGKEYAGRRRLYGEVIDSLIAEVIEIEKLQLVDMRKDLEEEYEKRKTELEAEHAKKMEEFENRRRQWLNKF
uniref:Uncharacterized protein n=1 Tax=Chenopodium quinoa TaxID=63459 RepID=A0A803N453_CHEQI